MRLKTHVKIKHHFEHTEKMIDFRNKHLNECDSNAKLYGRLREDRVQCVLETLQKEMVGVSMQIFRTQKCGLGDLGGVDFYIHLQYVKKAPIVIPAQVTGPRWIDRHRSYDEYKRAILMIAFPPNMEFKELKELIRKRIREYMFQHHTKKLMT